MNKKMNDKCICKKCGHEMKPLSDIHPIGMTCPNCGWGWATTYIDPINIDECDYHVIVTSGDNSLSVIKVVSDIANCNYIEAKKIIENTPAEIYIGKAVNVKAIMEQLKSAGIDFSIKPEFPY